ncbi:DegV family protein [bacterium]|nr:DegV family protein [bacterium]
MTIQIVTDSTSDIPPEVRANLPISVVPLHVQLNGHEYLDNENLTRQAFYEALPTSDPHPTTGAPSPERFLSVYNDLIDQGADAIFSIHISETLSAVINSAQLAAKRVEKIPVYVIDSGNLSLAEGLIVIMAAKAAKEGKDVETIQSMIDSAVKRAHAFAKLDTIDYLQKGGRINSIQHSVISILGIKPIMKMNNHVSGMKIARTKSKAFAKVLNLALKVFPKAESFGITHANVPDQVKDLIAQIKEHLPELPEPWVSEVTPALGVHVGPGALCINWIEGKNQQEHERKGIKEWIS